MIMRSTLHNERAFTREDFDGCGTPMRVLLIEDDEDDYILIRNLLDELFKSRFELEWVKTYESALHALDSHRYDICLLDYRLGERNGVELLNEVHAGDCIVPIIVITALGSYEVDREAMRAGAADYLVKSCLTADLLERSIRYSINRRRAEEALQKSAEKIKIFAYCVSHDLKSPAVGIHGLARLLGKQYSNVLDERGRKYCDQILKASEQIVSLVDEINTFIKAKEAPLTVEAVSLKEIIQTVREEYSSQLKSRAIEWVVPEAAPKLMADRLSILRVLRNLVDNALKYGGKELSEIRIEYERTADSHVLAVCDNGVGIKREHCEKIFGPFQRDLTSKGIPGMGLGLAIVKEIAERHQGRVWVEPGPERGTRFVVAIP